MKLRSIVLIMSWLALASTLVGGYFYYNASKKAAVEKVKTQARWHAEAIGDIIEDRVSNHMRLMLSLSRQKEIRNALAAESHNGLFEANLILDNFNTSFDASVSYLMNRQGNTIASSNRNKPDSFIGKNYSFRPYFQNAIAGEPSVYMALGVTSGKRGIYYSHPVYTDGLNSATGVIVMKASVDNMEKNLLQSRFDYPEMLTLVTGPDGVIFISDDKKYLYQLLETISDLKMDRIVATRQFGNSPLEWSGFRKIGDDRILDAPGNEYIEGRKKIASLPGWEVVHLHNVNAIIKGVYTPFRGKLGSLLVLLNGIIGVSVVFLYKMAQADIRKRRIAEKALQSSEKRYRRVTENAKDMIYRMSLPDGRYEFVSPASKDVFGYEPDEFYHSQLLIRKIMHPDWHNYFKKQWALLIEGKMPLTYEYQIMHKSGEMRWINQRNVLILDENGKPRAIEGIATDVTGMKLAEIKLTRSRDTLNAILDSTADGILVVNQDGDIIFYNEKFKHLWRIPDDLLRSKDDEKLLEFVLVQLHQPDKFIKKVKELYNTTRVDFDTLDFKDGRIFERYTRPLSHGDAIAGRVWSFRDITENKKSEAEREKLIADLQNALAEVRTLRGILPICSHCKKIRDDKGYWSQIESYIKRHSEAEFSHSICQDCAAIYYPYANLYDNE